LARVVGAAEPVNSPQAPCPPSQRCSNRAAINILGWQPTHSILPQGLQ
jgi:hypothetical protein